MTNSFKEKLGQGGFGAVYKGKLVSGCPVAVKILNASKGNGEEFINEVASISRTSHVNVVTLLGFCFDGGKKALIYEFMSNGSLDKLEMNNDLRPDEVMTTEENVIARRMTIVGLWCIQTFPSDRPTISKVIDMLEDNNDPLEIPPKPMHSSPTRSIPESSTS
ncbi:Serine-threonine/tyrosine-protein kinase, catalytic domain [Sesbania bispinosa]|nr:Serine-threonine/tyrosine-protein kinase, catalytic domain [Sesbania bispinosa]